MSRSWQRQERMVAAWFKTFRNITSGSLNRGDNGQKRHGDIISDFCIVEVKRHKSVSMRKALETRRTAQKAGLPWAHIEFKTGQADMVAITLPYEDAKIVCEALRCKWEALSRMSSVRKSI